MTGSPAYLRLHFKNKILEMENFLKKHYPVDKEIVIYINPKASHEFVLDKDARVGNIFLSLALLFSAFFSFYFSCYKFW